MVGYRADALTILVHDVSTYALVHSRSRRFSRSRRVRRETVAPGEGATQREQHREAGGPYARPYPRSCGRPRRSVALSSVICRPIALGYLLGSHNGS